MEREDYLALFSPVHQGKARFMALASAVLSQADDLMELYREGLPAALSIETAKGFFLDTLAALSGVSRPTAGTSDEDLRKYLRVWIQLHHWDGSNGSLGEMLEAAFPGQEARLNDNMDGTVTASLEGSYPFNLKEVFPRPAGVRMTES